MAGVVDTEVVATEDTATAVTVGVTEVIAADMAVDTVMVDTVMVDMEDTDLASGWVGTGTTHQPTTIPWGMGILWDTGIHHTGSSDADSANPRSIKTAHPPKSGGFCALLNRTRTRQISAIRKNCLTPLVFPLRNLYNCIVLAVPSRSLANRLGRVKSTHGALHRLRCLNSRPSNPAHLHVFSQACFTSGTAREHFLQTPSNDNSPAPRPK